MAEQDFKEPSRATSSAGLRWRVPLALIAVPLFVPAAMTLCIQGSGESLLYRYLTNLMLSGTFTFIAMLVLGLPLLLVYLRLNQRSFLGFALGGGLCATITAFAVATRTDIGLLIFYGFFGVIAGVLFRLILFGVRRSTPRQAA